MPQSRHISSRYDLRRDGAGSHWPQLPRDREDDVVVGDVEQIVEHPIRPPVGRLFAAARTEARLAGVRHHPGLSAAAAIEVAAQDRGLARQDLADRLEDHRPNPTAGSGHELCPVIGEDQRQSVADLETWVKHAPSLSYRAQGSSDPPRSQRGLTLDPCRSARHQRSKSSRAERAKFGMGSGLLKRRHGRGPRRGHNGYE